MKGLDIVNKKIENSKERIEKINLQLVEDEISKEQIELSMLKAAHKHVMEEYLEIKKDLEVLEILMKHIGISKYEHFNAIEVALLIDRGSTKEQFDKVMKCMEENENV